MAKTFKVGEGFGKREFDAFLNAIHIALCAGVPKRKLSEWIMEGLKKSSADAYEFIAYGNSKIVY